MSSSMSFNPDRTKMGKENLFSRKKLRVIILVSLLLEKVFIVLLFKNILVRC